MIYLVGDLQGCCDAFERLLTLVDFSPSRDHVYLLGDLVNRGPASLATLERLQGLGDAAAYQKTRQVKDSAYYEIQDRVRRAINNDLYTPGEPNRPLVIIAHSLGCHIASSFTWDLNKLKQQQRQQQQPVVMIVLNPLLLPILLALPSATTHPPHHSRHA